MWEEQFPFLSRRSCLVVPTAWRPLEMWSHITIPWVMHPAISNLEQKPLALASGGSHPGVIGTDVHTSASARCPQWWLSVHTHTVQSSHCSPSRLICIFFLNAAQSVPILAAWASMSMLLREGGKCYGQESMHPLQLKLMSLWQIHVSVPASAWSQAIFKPFSRDIALELLKWHSFPVCLQTAYCWELLPAHAAAAHLPAWTSPLCSMGLNKSWEVTSLPAEKGWEMGREALTPPCQGDSTALRAWMCSTSEHALGTHLGHCGAGWHSSALSTGSPHLPQRPPVGHNPEGKSAFPPERVSCANLGAEGAEGWKGSIEFAW